MSNLAQLQVGDRYQRAGAM